MQKTKFAPDFESDRYYRLYKEIYKLLDQPVIEGYDCGLLCGARCCSGEGGRGIYLYPNEEVMFDGDEAWLEWRVHRKKWYDLPEPLDKLYFLKCKGGCTRDKRPLQCRLYPFLFRLEDSGSLLVTTNDFGHDCSILSRGHNVSEAFMNNLQKAGEILLSIPGARELIASGFFGK